MRRWLSAVAEHFENIKNILAQNAVKELLADDDCAERLLDSYILKKNSRRVYTFTAFQLFIGIFGFVFGFLFAGKPDSGLIFSAVGSLIHIASAVVFFSAYSHELSQRKQDEERMKAMLRIYWGAFIFGGMMNIVGEYQTSHTVYWFLIYLILVQFVPIFHVIGAAVSGAVFLIPAIIFGILEHCGLIYYVLLVLAAAFWIWGFALKYNCYAGMWINRRRLDTVEERCLRISHTDSLTGMLNKAGLSEKFRERYSSSNENRKVAVILIDVDNFRRYNHSFGYDKSDECLYTICNCIRIMAKPVTDIVSRFGGDDFVLIIEDKTEVEVLSFAEQLREAVERMALPAGEGRIVTISIGISEIRVLDGKATYSELLNEADLQLMIAKHNGKNCIGYRSKPFIHELRRKVQ